MFASAKGRRRIDDAIAVASPLALSEAMNAYISRLSPEDVLALAKRSAKRMESGERKQLGLYLDLNEPGDLAAHRFVAFLRQNPRAIAALDRDAIEAILFELGEIPPVEHLTRRLSPRVTALVALAVAVAVLPLAAQYAHQRGLLDDLRNPILPVPIVPFVQTVAAHAVKPARPVKRRIAAHKHVAPRRRIARVHRRVPARAVALHRPAPVRRETNLAWKFDPHNNPYVDRPRRGAVDTSAFAQRARISVSAYLRAIIDGNLPAAFAHLGLPANAGTDAIAELPIVARDSTVAIVSSKPRTGGNEEVQADIVTHGREYYEVFYVKRDGPAVRITDRYYIPVNRSAQVAVRTLARPH